MKYNLESLYLKKNNDLTELKSNNYITHGTKTPIAEFCHSYLSMSPERVFELQKKMTQLHCDHEMNFQIKDSSGQYNQVVATPFHGFAPLPYSYVEKLVNSTRPILEFTRKLLQNLYSQKELTPENLNIKKLSPEDQEELIQIIKNNIYYEPNYTHENLKDYPFLSVVGFDSAIEDLEKPQNTFFEFNAGTPCGVEDQDQLMKHFENLSPELWSKIAPFIPQDESHSLLKDTINNCAKKWTGVTDGISIILSPGPYNPAHPEIAAIARKSGMPLVKMQDLYIDSNGHLRMKVKEGDHPKVTGIYNRKEESFLTYSKKHGIPLRSPFASINHKLNKDFDLNLQDGILYSYRYNSENEIIGVDFENDIPLYQNLFDSISCAPDGNFYGDIIDAIWSKKLYVSNLGGRVFDDKRAFRIFSNYLNKTAAHPPKTIELKNLEKKFDSAVIKAPDLSGGSGVFIGAQLNQKEKENLLEEIKKRPYYYEIQKFQKLAVIPSYTPNLDSVPLAVDWRLIIFFSSDEDVKFSSNSCLVRTAPLGEIKTNTSAGGGYALALMYKDSKQKKYPQNIPTPKYISASREEQKDRVLGIIKNFEIEINNLNIENFIYEIREILDLFPVKSIPFLQELRSFQTGNITKDDIISQAKYFFP